MSWTESVDGFFAKHFGPKPPKKNPVREKLDELKRQMNVPISPPPEVPSVPSVPPPQPELLRIDAMVYFEKIDAFAIERLENGKTNVGWLDKDGKSHEWSMMSSNKLHVYLVQEFNNYVQRKRRQQARWDGDATEPVVGAMRPLPGPQDPPRPPNDHPVA